MSSETFDRELVESMTRTPGAVWEQLGEWTRTNRLATDDWPCRGELADVRRKSGGWVTATIVGADGARFRTVAPPETARLLHDWLQDGVAASWIVRMQTQPDWGVVQLRLVDFVTGTVTTGDLAAETAAAWTLLEPQADANAQRTLPAAPRRAAVITAPGSAGWADVQARLADHPRLQLELLPAPMGGPRAAEEIAGRLRSAAVAAADVVLVVRGGGDGRQWADDLQVARAIVDCPRQVWTAIGHATDHHLADRVAADSFPTPSAAATRLLELQPAAPADRPTATSSRPTDGDEVAQLRRTARRLQLVLAAVVVVAAAVWLATSVGWL